MKRLPVNVALVVVVLALLGALLHPLALLLSLLPVNSTGVVKALAEVRTAIADLLGWALAALLAVMAGYVIKSRLIDRTGEPLVSTSAAAQVASESPPSRSPSVIVAITAYNDADATAQAVRDFRRQREVAEVLVIDNNSTDRTAELAVAAGATVIREPRQGYGFACMRGLTEAIKRPEAEVIVLTEGDGTFVADDLPKFLAYMGHSDLVLGNRTVRGLVESDSQMDHFFTWGNMAVAMLLRLRSWDGRFLGPAGLSDVGCTFRAIRRSALESILPDLNVGGNHFSPHMILVALARHLSVVEIPIRFRRRIGQSKGASRSLRSGVGVGISMIWHILTFTPPASQKSGIVVERDGLIIRPVARETTWPVRMEFVPGAVETLAELSRRGHKVVVVADQRAHKGVGISRRLSKAIDARIVAEVQHHGGRVDAFFVCPHEGDRPCACRDARPELLLRAAREVAFDLRRSTVVSDRPRFLEAAAGLGCLTIHAGTGSSEQDRDPTSGTAPDLVRALAPVIGSVEPVPIQLSHLHAQS